MLQLRITGADGEAKLCSLDGRSVLSIGRSESEDLCLPDRKVSRRHAKLSLENGRCFLEDLSSRTGTRVNGVSLSSRTEIFPGDRIQLGETELVLERIGTDPGEEVKKSPETRSLSAEPSAREEKGAGTVAREDRSDRHLPLYAAQSSLVALYSETMIRLARQVQNRVLELLNIGNTSVREMTSSEMAPESSEDCNLCGTCIEVCPTRAISLSDNRIVTDAAACTLCCACVKYCPQEARIFNTPFTKFLYENFSSRREPEWFI